MQKDETLTEQEKKIPELDIPDIENMSWLQKQQLKMLLKKLKKVNKKAQKKQDIDERKLRTAIWSLTDTMTLYKDDKQEHELTVDDLQEMNSEKLIIYLNEIIDETKKLI